ncbi:MAG: thiolase family protein [Actinobacteria bacterium]|nr:thiolase family protein [Actinomycetota bacterium]
MKVFIAEAARTPFGAHFGALSNIRPDDLLGATIRELVAKTPSLNKNKIDDVVIGDANGVGEDNRNVARMGALLAGLPETVPGVTINRLCGSGAEAVIQGSRAIKTGDTKFLIAGGVESMSRAPWIVRRTEKKFPEKVEIGELNQSTVGWRMTNPNFPGNWTESLGRCSEKVAAKLGISRVEQDEWALRSHQLADRAWNSKFHDGFVFPFGGLTRDESIRTDTSLAKLADLPSVFSEGGTGTAGNSSPINDGAVTMLLTDESGIKDLAIDSNLSGGFGEILGSKVVARSPDEFSLAPVDAINGLLSKLLLSFKDIEIWEINEAFASMVLTVLKELPEIDRNRVNVNGGAIAIGHPVGASAARVIVDTTRELRRRGGGIGIAAACIGVGLGVAIAIRV